MALVRGSDPTEAAETIEAILRDNSAAVPLEATGNGGPSEEE